MTKKMELDTKLEKLFNKADNLAVKEVERLARLVLKNNPKELKSFVMAMGSYFFIDNKDKVIITMKGHDSFLQELEGYKELVKFVDKWDSYFKLTGTPMRFTANGKKITFKLE